MRKLLFLLVLFVILACETNITNPKQLPFKRGFKRQIAEIDSVKVDSLKVKLCLDE